MHQVALAAEKTCRENVLISLRIWQDRFPSQPEPWRIRSGNGYVLISLHIWRARSPFAPGRPDSRENLLISLRIWRDRFPSQPGPSRIRSGNRHVLISLHTSREREISNCAPNALRKRSNFIIFFLRIWRDRFSSQPRTVDERPSYTGTLPTNPTRNTFWLLCVSGWQNLRFYVHDGTGLTWMPIQGIESPPPTLTKTAKTLAAQPAAMPPAAPKPLSRPPERPT